MIVTEVIQQRKTRNCVLFAEDSVEGEQDVRGIYVTKKALKELGWIEGESVVVIIKPVDNGD